MKTSRELLTAGAVALFGISLGFGPPALNAQTDQETQTPQQEQSTTTGSLPGERVGQQQDRPGERVGQQDDRPGERVGQQDDRPGERVGQRRERPEAAPGQVGQSQEADVTVAEETESQIEVEQDREVEYGATERDTSVQTGTRVEQQTQTQTQTSSSQLQRYTSNQLQGRSVVTSAGEEIGSIDSLAIDLESGQVAYAVVSSGGIFGIGSELRVVPAQMLDISREGEELTVRIDTTGKAWASVPAVDRQEIANLCEPDRAREIYQRFGLSWDEQGYFRIRREGEAEVQPAATECRLVLTRSVKGQRILGAQEAELGEIDNIVVDLASGEVLYVLVAPETRFFWEQPDELFAIPTDSIDSVGDDRVVVSVTEQQLQEARQMTSAQIGETRESQQVFRIGREQVRLFGGREAESEQVDTARTSGQEQAESVETTPDAQAQSQQQEQQVQVTRESESETDVQERETTQFGARTDREEAEVSQPDDSQPELQRENRQGTQPSPDARGQQDQQESREFQGRGRDDAPGRALGRDDAPGRGLEASDRDLPEARDAENRPDVSQQARDTERRRDPGSRDSDQVTGEDPAQQSQGREFGASQRGQQLGTDRQLPTARDAENRSDAAPQARDTQQGQDPASREQIQGRTSGSQQRSGSDSQSQQQNSGTQEEDDEQTRQSGRTR